MVAFKDATPAPNPCSYETNFGFQLPAGMPYSIKIYDVLGRITRTLTGTASGTAESVRWDLLDEGSQRVQAGVYLYYFESTIVNSSGKIVVR